MEVLVLTTARSQVCSHCTPQMGQGSGRSIFFWPLESIPISLFEPFLHWIVGEGQIREGELGV